MKTISVIAPAKVNLFLGIGDYRDDGFHNATTVMHTLSMHDRLTLTRIGCGEHVVVSEPNDVAQPERSEEVKVEPGSGLSIVVRNLWMGGITPLDIAVEDNLAYKAIRMLAEEIGRKEDEVIRVVVEKQIPHQAGLGGGSSDAAAALVGAARLWGIDPDAVLLRDVARVLGVDVCFFMYGGCALLEGRGDVLDHRLTPRKDSVVIIRPNVGVSTSAAYRLFDESPQFFDAALLAAVRGAQNALDVPLGNNLQVPALQLQPIIAEVHRLAREFPGVADVLLCGSGSALFAVCEDFNRAQALVAQAQREGYWARATSFSSLGVAALPDRR